MSQVTGIHEERVAKKKRARAISIATKFYIERMTKEQIAEDEGLSVSSVRRWLRFSQRIKVVKMKYEVVSETEEKPSLNHQLAGELMELYNLINCIVVDNAGYSEPFQGRKDDKLHRLLARALALVARSIIRSGDLFGVVGGRATNDFAMALADPEMPLMNQNHVRIVSLGGNVNTMAAETKMPIDADDVAYKLSRAFKDAEVKRLALPVAVPIETKKAFVNNGQGQAISPDKWVEEEKTKQREERVLIPNILLLGIGALCENHRFLHLDDYEMAPIKEPLTDLIVEMKKCEKKYKYCPVGDIGYRLFFIRPPDGSHNNEFEKKIKQLVEKLNAHIMAICEDQIRMVDNVIAVAGGPNKTNAIYEILKGGVDGRRLISMLCTDNMTAEALIKRERGRRKGIIS